jgi:hypothetical protein
MNILLYADLAADDYPEKEMIQWLKDMLKIRPDPDGRLDFWVCLNRAPESVCDIIPRGRRCPVDPDHYCASLHMIREQIGSLDILFLYGRNDRLQQAARKCRIPVVSFFEASYPLNGWIVDSPHHQAALTVSMNDTKGACVYHGRPDMMNVIPSFVRYYNRFRPYTGCFAHVLYNNHLRKVVIPVFSDYRRWMNGSDPARTSGSDLDEWLQSILPVHEKLLYLVVPMDTQGSWMPSVSSVRDDTHVHWLTVSEGKHQILSLIDKADGVLALDIRAAVLPMLMGKWTCRLPGLSDLSVQWPSFTEWLAHDAPVPLTNCNRCFQRQCFVLNCCILPKTGWAVWNIIQNVRRNKIPLLDNHTQMREVLESCYTAEERGLCQRALYRRKLKKLWRNPHGYCADSRSPLLQKIARFLVSFQSPRK